MLLEVRKTLVWGTAVAAVASAMLLAATSDGALRINEAARSHDDPGTYPTAGGRLGSADARNAIAVGPTGDAR